MRSLAVATLVALLASPAFAQNATPPAGGAGMGQRRFQPPPNHWMTFDSLSQALSLSADQRTKITPAYTALNGVMKDAAARRQAIRQQAGLGRRRLHTRAGAYARAARQDGQCAHRDAGVSG